MKAKKLIEEGAIGDVRFAHVSYYRQVTEDEREGCWRVQPEIAGGGVFMDMAVHQLDALDFILGKITDVKSFSANQAGYYEPEDIVNMSFTFESGAMGSGDWCFTADVRRDLIEIVGDKGRITFECFGTDPVRLETLVGVWDFAEPTPEHIQQNLIQSIVDELNGEDTCPSTLYTAARTAWVCDKVYGKL
jgi:predicted dehydrogenase